MFATAHGTVRRNSMAAFTNIPTAGKIAMRFGTSVRRNDLLLNELLQKPLTTLCSRLIRIAARKNVKLFRRQLSTGAGGKGTDERLLQH